MTSELETNVEIAGRDETLGNAGDDLEYSQTRTCRRVPTAYLEFRDVTGLERISGMIVFRSPFYPSLIFVGAPNNSQAY